MNLKVRFDKTLYERVEFIESILRDYIKTTLRVFFQPGKTIKQLVQIKRDFLNPFLFFCINVLISMILRETKNLNETLGNLSKNIFFTTQPSWNELMKSYLSYFLGIIFFIIVYRYLERKILKCSTSIETITTSLFYSSFAFLPIIVCERLFWIIYKYSFFKSFSQIINENKANGLFSTITIILVLSLIFFFYWLYFLYCGLVNSSNHKKKIPLVLFLTCVCYFIFQMGIVNLPMISKLGPTIEAYGSLIHVKKAIATNPPDYFEAAWFSYDISKNEAVPPYVRYKYCMKAMIYLTGYIEKRRSLLFTNSIKADRNENYSWIEKTYEKVIPNTFEKQMDSKTYGLMLIMKDCLNTAKKTKKDPDFRIGDNNVGVYFGFSNKPSEYIKVTPLH